MKASARKVELEKLLGLIQWSADTDKEMRPFLNGVAKALSRMARPELLPSQKKLTLLLAKLDSLQSGKIIDAVISKEIQESIKMIYKNKGVEIFSGSTLGEVEFRRMSDTVGRARRRRKQGVKNGRKIVKGAGVLDLSVKAKMKLLDLTKDYDFSSPSDALVRAIDVYFKVKSKKAKSRGDEMESKHRFYPLENAVTEVTSMRGFPFGKVRPDAVVKRS